MEKEYHSFLSVMMGMAQEIHVYWMNSGQYSSISQLDGSQDHSNGHQMVITLPLSCSFQKNITTCLSSKKTEKRKLGRKAKDYR